MLINGELTCRELVELVTDYFEGALEDEVRARFEAHLDICPACVAYLEQMRETVRVTGMLTVERLDPRARDELMAAFRRCRAGGEPRARNVNGTG